MINEKNQYQQIMLQEFDNDSKIIGEETEKFLDHVYPSYLVDKKNIEDLLEIDSVSRIEGMTFFRIIRVTADNVEKVFENISEKFEKLFTALYSINVPISYGLVSRDGVTNVVLGIYGSSDVESVKTIAKGMLTDIDLEPFSFGFVKSQHDMQYHHGILTGVPSLYVKEKKQTFSFSSIMRSLNGKNYTLLFVAKPVSQEIISQQISDLIYVKDQAFAVSKRNIARSDSYTKTINETFSSSDTASSSETKTRAGEFGDKVGGKIPLVSKIPLVGNKIKNISVTVGGGLGNFVGKFAGNSITEGVSHTKSYSKAISDAITNGNTISGDIQNGFAVELMNYTDSAIERLKAGQNNGVWQTAIIYSAENHIARDVIKACLCGELSRLDAEKLPLLSFEPNISNKSLRLPKFLEDTTLSPLCSLLNSSELGLLCTVPVDSVPGFELRLEKKYPMSVSRLEDDHVRIGSVADGKRELPNIPFGMNYKDLNKHTFVCGMPGYGKTTTVKKILIEAKDIPFLVIEPAKKEYRNLNVNKEVYTMGRPEISALRINPFYIIPGVSPQMHIDFLKDLFNASFSFYGPMPYILEKCLYSVYRKKGWDLVFGYHPMLSNNKSEIKLYDINETKKQYVNDSHKYLFPTMQDLKDEIARYVDEELKYEGEVASNVKTAMKVRLENLCDGTKGDAFNTYDFLDFEELLKNKVIFELDGLSDDDRAFGVGLLTIFINEFRRVEKESDGNKELKLKHLLVIEEAHRLLKNIDTKRTSENIGNPQGKAVEHFTNMIAEMRAYGQGVIVAEQIPTELAPNVIKNTSNKIVHRIVSGDEQQVIANTIGMSVSDALQLGSLEQGYAYCHKEGMALPILAKIHNFNENNGKSEFDISVSDEILAVKNKDRFKAINLGIISGQLGDDKTVKTLVLRYLNTLMTENEDICMNASHLLIKKIENKIKLKGLSFTLEDDEWNLYSCYMTQVILSSMVTGIYKSEALPTDELGELITSNLYSPDKNKIIKIKDFLKKLYSNNLSKFSKNTVARLIFRALKSNTDITGTIKEYYLLSSQETIDEVAILVKNVGVEK